MADYDEWYCEHRLHHNQCANCRPDKEPQDGREAFWKAWRETLKIREARQ